MNNNIMTDLPDNSDSDITLWLSREGGLTEAAASRIWDEFYARLLRLSQRKLRAVKGTADEEDIAASAMKSFFRRFEQFHLEDRDDIWKLLSTILRNKTASSLRRQLAQKRGGGRLAKEADFQEEEILASVCDEEGMPELVEQAIDACSELIDLLPNEKMQATALWKFQDYTHAEIASKMNCSTSLVKQRVKRIREIWTRSIRAEKE